MRGEYSLSDIAAATGNNEGFGGANGAWWLIIIIVLFGWGRGGYGFGGSGSEGASNNYVLASDFATIQRQLSDGFSDLRTTGINLGNGIANLGYTQAQLINGVDKTILTSTNTLGSQLADVGYGIKDCCCQQLRAIDGINFNNAQNTCTITNSIAMNSRDIIDSQNAGTKAILDAITANRMEDLREANRQLRDRNTSLELAASQNAQTCDIKAYVQEQVNPRPYPAYVVPNPYCNCNNGCGCNM